MSWHCLPPEDRRNSSRQRAGASRPPPAFSLFNAICESLRSVYCRRHQATCFSGLSLEAHGAVEIADQQNMAIKSATGQYGQTDAGMRLSDTQMSIDWQYARCRPYHTARSRPLTRGLLSLHPAAGHCISPAPGLSPAVNRQIAGTRSQPDRIPYPAPTRAPHATGGQSCHSRRNKPAH